VQLLDFGFSWQFQPPIDPLDQNLVELSPQADLKSAMTAFTPLFCMKNKQNPTKPTFRIPNKTYKTTYTHRTPEDD
jgi:hypothetical protein